MPWQRNNGDWKSALKAFVQDPERQGTPFKLVHSGCLQAVHSSQQRTAAIRPLLGPQSSPSCDGEEPVSTVLCPASSRPYVVSHLEWHRRPQYNPDLVL